MSEIHTNAYAYINKIDYLRISSSGGAFLGISKAFFDMNKGHYCSVYGTSFDKNLIVKHTRVTDFEKSKRFCGSKYVYSDCTEAYKHVQDDLKNDYKVLFTGTPCQIAALKKILEVNGLNQDNLITVDIVCHGTPKPDIWLEYKKYIETKEKNKLKKFSFRYKPAGWKGYPTYAEFENGRKYINAYKMSHYITLFRKDLLMRQGCFNCTFPGNYHSDITIADFWGIELCMPEIDSSKGVSLVIFHNKNNEELKSVLKKNAMVMKEATDLSYLRYNHNLTKNTTKPQNYDDFWNDYNKYGMEYVIRKYAGNSVKDRIYFEVVRILRKSGLLYRIKKIMKKA